MTITLREKGNGGWAWGVAAAGGAATATIDIPVLTPTEGYGMLDIRLKGELMGQRGKNTPLSLEVAWRVKQEYERRDQRGNRLFSMRQVAATFGISETSVLRIVTNTGKFANLHNEPLPEVIPEGELDRAASSSLERLQQMLAVEKDERTPGKTRADKLLAEMEGKGEEVSQQVKDRLKDYLG